ncbi:MAG: helix-turn-helix domain-containing protein [Dehalococcoidia bacterium]
MPQKARRLLPEWIGGVPTIEALPQDSIGLVDESYTLFHSRTSSSDRARALSSQINLSRQRGITLIFVSQESRQVDKNIVSSADIIIFKNPGVLQLEFERRELRRIAEEARKMFDTIGDKNKRKWAYVFAPRSDFVGMLANSLPSFWTPSLSKAYADSTPAEGMTIPKTMTPDEKKRKAKELGKDGWSYSRIGKYFGVSRSTAYNWVHDYPFRRS